MPVTIRTALSSDVPAILAIEQQSPSASHWTSSQYNKLIASDSGVVLIAEDKEELRGFICAQTIAGEWQIENIVVVSQFLRRGIASQLLQTLIEKARAESAPAVLLEVRESNCPARRLYDRHGFREVGRRHVYYQDPADDAILYTLKISSALDRNLPSIDK
jgi:ribosomal-protein-alanine acetyltransferase